MDTSTNDVKTLDDVIKSLESAHAEIAKLRGCLEDKFDFESNLEQRIASLEAENREIKTYASDLEEYVLNLDSTTRKRNLVISGLNETKGETTDSLLLRVFKFLMSYVEFLELSDIDCVYRLGKRGGRSRPILCKFVKEKTRNDVAAIKMNLNDEDSEKKIYLNDDLPQLINDRRANFRTIVKLAKSQNIPVSMGNNKITVNSVTYSHHNLDCLPAGLRLEDAKMVKVNGGIAFFTSHAWASNFYPSPIVVQGQNFRTPEHAYQYAKAIRLGDPHTANFILRAKTPSEAKQLGGGVILKPKWDDDKIDVMRHIVSEKFKQHKDLRDKLLSTGQENLIEASLDSFWGAKATLNSKSIKDGTWTGANTLGKIIAEVRAEIKREVDAFRACLPNATSREQVTQTLPPTAATVARQPERSADEASVNNNNAAQLFPVFGRGKGRGRGIRRQSGNQTGYFRQTQPQVQEGISRKNKTRPSSSSSNEGTYASVVSQKKKARTQSPLSALPPPRIPITELFSSQGSFAEAEESPFDDDEEYY